MIAFINKTNTKSPTTTQENDDYLRKEIYDTLKNKKRSSTKSFNNEKRNKK